jgi:hypothetical protein
MGTHYSIPRRFGIFETAPLLEALADELPVGWRLVLVTPIDKVLRRAIAQFATRKPVLFSRGTWYLSKKTDEASAIGELARFARRNAVRELAVWVLAETEEKDPYPLVEAEDSNDYVWVSETLPRQAHERIVASVGGATEHFESAALP